MMGAKKMAASALSLLAMATCVLSYGFNNFTESDMKDLLALQNEYYGNLTSAHARGALELIASCECLFKGELSCGCCAGLRIWGYDYKACLSGGLRQSPSELFIRFELLGKSWEFTLAPELCVGFPGFWIVRFCVGIYHHDICLDTNDLSWSSFKVCLQADIVFLIPVFTVDFNCLWYHDKTFDIDDSLHSDRAGLITYKIGKGVSTVFGRSEADAKTVLVGRIKEDRRLSALGGGGGRRPGCRRTSKFRMVCDEGKKRRPRRAHLPPLNHTTTPLHS